MSNPHTVSDPNTVLNSSPRPQFGARLAAAVADRGPLCVGIDPHVSLLNDWNLPDTPQGRRDFSLRTLEAVAGRVAAVKPQAAFFERHGSAGLAVLEEVIAVGQEADTLVIVDAKRGDIGSTMGAYAEAFLREGSPLAGDALTVSPYLGFGSLQPAVDLALATGRGLFALCLTSNPEGASVQHAVGQGGNWVSRQVADEAGNINRAVTGESGEMGPIGLVIGATVGSALADSGIDLVADRSWVLAPGVGAQGGDGETLRQVFGAARGQVLASSSRGILAAGPDIAAIQKAANHATIEATAALGW